MRVRLETRLGQRVTEGELLPHFTPFEILLWGSRHFVHQAAPSKCQGEEGMLIYQEGYALTLIEGTTWQEDEHP